MIARTCLQRACGWSPEQEPRGGRGGWGAEPRAALASEPRPAGVRVHGQDGTLTENNMEFRECCVEGRVCAPHAVCNGWRSRRSPRRDMDIARSQALGGLVGDHASASSPALPFPRPSRDTAAGTSCPGVWDRTTLPWTCGRKKRRGCRRPRESSRRVGLETAHVTLELGHCGLRAGGPADRACSRTDTLTGTQSQTRTHCTRKKTQCSLLKLNSCTCFSD